MESGLVNLRAELHKKRAETNKFSAEEAKLRHKLKPLAKESLKNSKKQSSHKCKTNDESICDDEEALNLEKSRKALEKKAALYDQIKGGTEVLEDDELNERFLIDFQEKIYKEVSETRKEREKKDEKSVTTEDSESYKAKNQSEEWVEYIDGFGRTRVCQQKDLEYLKGQGESSQPSFVKPESQFQKKCGKIEEETREKTDVHYQDVLFDEARAHGTSFMPFSRDEEERAAQQQLLKDLGVETAKATLTKEALKRKRQKLMKERLTKVRQKKRLKMGLPMNDDDDKLKTPPASDEDDDMNDDRNNDVIPDVDSVTPANSVVVKPDPEKKPTRIRQWDIGKPGVGATMSQEQWIESRRITRENEFAPPSSYQRSREISSSKHAKREPRRETLPQQTSFSPMSEVEVLLETKREERNSDFSPMSEVEVLLETKREERNSDFAPPCNYDYYRPTTTKKSFSLGSKIDLESAISQGLSQLRKEYYGTND